MTVRQLQGNVLYEFGAREARCGRSCLAASARRSSAPTDLHSETKLSFHGGGGLNYFAWRNIGMRVHARFKPTILDDDIGRRLLRSLRLLPVMAAQFEFGAGAVVRF